MRIRVLICVIFLLVMSVTIVHASTPVKPVCAPSVPPPVLGPLVQPAVVPGLILINEVLTTSRAQWSCSVSTQYAAQDAWVELYNPQNQNIDLYAMHCALDSGPGPASSSYPFPFGAAIAAHSFLVLFPRYSGVYNVLLSGASTLRLLFSGTVVDQVQIPPLGIDTSYARVPDGSNNWVTTSSPTIDSSNILSQSNVSLTATHISKVPLPPEGTGSSRPLATARSTSKKSSTGSSTTGVTDSSQAQTNATTTALQPTWTALQFPIFYQTTATAETQNSLGTDKKRTSAFIQPSNVSLGLVQKVLFSLALLIAVLLLLLVRRLRRRTPDV